MEIKKFQLEGYDPLKPNDAQLGDDWRLTCAKFSTMRDGGESEFNSIEEVEKFGIKLLAEILKRGRITFHPEDTKPVSLELLRKCLDILIKGGLYLTEPHGELIYDGKKSAIVKSREFKKLEDFNILVSDAKAYGFIRFRQAKKIDLEEFGKREPEHKISEEERAKWWPSKTELFFYLIRDFVKYNKPRTIKPVTGAQVFIDNVEILKSKRDGPIVVIPDFICQVGSSVGEEKPRDRDILFRLDPCEHNESLRESLTLLMRKELDPEKEDLPLHYIFNASGPHDDYLPLFDLKLEPKEAKIVAIKSITPGKRFDVMKPAMAGTTDYFNTDELWDKWAKDKLEKHKLAGQVKYDGFRCIISKNGKVSAWFEDSKEDRADDIKDIVEAVKDLPSFVVDCEITAEKDGKPIPRTQLMSLLAGKLEAIPIAHVFDCLFWDGEDLSEKPYSERCEYAKKFVKQTKNEFIKLVESKPITDKDSLQSVGRACASQPYSEGLIVKVLDAPYQFDGTDSMAKWKTTFALKCEVIEAIKKENGWTYHCGLKKGDSDFKNVTDGLVDLGNTFVSAEKIADKGETIEVRVEEIIILKEDGKEKLAWGKPEAVGVDKSRGAYSAPQAIDMARRAHVLKEEVEKLESPLLGTGGMIAQVIKLQEEEGETRGERAEEFWQENWQDCYPKSGKGRFIYHHHWRGLSEEEAKLNEKDLLQTEHSVHGDLRCQYSDEYAWGFTVFLGTTRDVREASGSRLANLKENDKLQGDFKLKVPMEWLKVGVPKPYVGEPGSVGSTENAYTKFFAYDSGDYDIGVARLHLREIFLHGKELKGRFLMQYAPVGGDRKWLISKPTDQTPYTESHKLENVVKELRQKKQKWLLWAKPGEKPELIDIEKTTMQKSWQVPLLKSQEERFVYGIVLQPDIEDGQGDVVSSEEIRKAAHQFLENCQRIGIEHEFINPQIKIWESYIAPQNLLISGQKIVGGAWILGVHILDDKVWNSVKKGSLTGFSIKGWANTRRAN